MRNKTLLIALPLIALIAAGTAGAFWYKSVHVAETEADIAAHDMQDGLNTAAGEPQLVPTTGAQEAAQEAANPEAAGHEDHATVAEAAPATAASDIHIKAEGTDPKSPKSIGKFDAPVTMLEYSSLTCPHCAHAHATVLPQLIKDYVETGKLRIVFNDFPLNQQAMDASKVSRCVSNDQYFNFLTMLFGSIEQWAYSGNHPNALIQNAVLAGLPEDKAKACMADVTVEQALISGIQDANSKYRVEATPTFVLNDGKRIISGARPYEEFKAAIDALLAEQPAQ